MAGQPAATQPVPDQRSRPTTGGMSLSGESDPKPSSRPAPPKAVPSKAAPSKSAPSKAAPSKSAPSKAAPSKAAPSRAAPPPSTRRSARVSLQQHIVEHPVRAPIDGTAPSVSPRPGSARPPTQQQNSGEMDSKDNISDPAQPGTESSQANAFPRIRVEPDELPSVYVIKEDPATGLRYAPSPPQPTDPSRRVTAPNTRPGGPAPFDTNQGAAHQRSPLLPKSPRPLWGHNTPRSDATALQKAAIHGRQLAQQRSDASSSKGVGENQEQQTKPPGKRSQPSKRGTGASPRLGKQDNSRGSAPSTQDSEPASGLGLGLGLGLGISREDNSDRGESSGPVQNAPPRSGSGLGLGQGVSTGDNNGRPHPGRPAQNTGSGSGSGLGLGLGVSAGNNRPSTQESTFSPRPGVTNEGLGGYRQYYYPSLPYNRPAPQYNGAPFNPGLQYSGAAYTPGSQSTGTPYSSPAPQYPGTAYTPASQYSGTPYNTLHPGTPHTSPYAYQPSSGSGLGLGIGASTPDNNFRTPYPTYPTASGSSGFVPGSEPVFAPPPGPPPPQVPEGWLAQWNSEYKKMFYVDLRTKKSQWEKPTEPVATPRIAQGRHERSGFGTAQISGAAPGPTPGPASTLGPYQGRSPGMGSPYGYRAHPLQMRSPYPAPGTLGPYQVMSPRISSPYQAPGSLNSALGLHRQYGHYPGRFPPSPYGRNPPNPPVAKPNEAVTPQLRGLQDMRIEDEPEREPPVPKKTPKIRRSRTKPPKPPVAKPDEAVTPQLSGLQNMTIKDKPERERPVPKKTPKIRPSATKSLNPPVAKPDKAVTPQVSGLQNTAIKDKWEPQRPWPKKTPKLPLQPFQYMNPTWLPQGPNPTARAPMSLTLPKKVVEPKANNKNPGDGGADGEKGRSKTPPYQRSIFELRASPLSGLPDPEPVYPQTPPRTRKKGKRTNSNLSPLKSSDSQGKRQKTTTTIDGVLVMAEGDSEGDSEGNSEDDSEEDSEDEATRNAGTQDSAGTQDNVGIQDNAGTQDSAGTQDNVGTQDDIEVEPVDGQLKPGVHLVARQGQTVEQLIDSQDGDDEAKAAFSRSLDGPSTNAAQAYAAPDSKGQAIANQSHAVLVHSLEHAAIAKHFRINRPLIFKTQEKRIDFFASLAAYPELLLDLVKWIPLKELISLYSISKDFHATLNGHMLSTLTEYARHSCPESARAFPYKLYRQVCIRDPVGRMYANNKEVRHVPSIRWLRMIMHREAVVHDILACLARESLRTPKTTSMVLKKAWVMMELSTNAQRVYLMHNERYWKDEDLIVFMIFITKLQLRFSDPLDGPSDSVLMKVMLGQKGFTPLFRLLKREILKTGMEAIQMALKYWNDAPPAHKDLDVFGVPAKEIGKGHLEGWGRGKIHLMRMDELVPREAARRNLSLSRHMLDFMMWGFVDPVTKKNIVVSADEKKFFWDDEIAFRRRLAARRQKEKEEEELIKKLVESEEQLIRLEEESDVDMRNIPEADRRNVQNTLVDDDSDDESVYENQWG